MSKTNFIISCNDKPICEIIVPEGTIFSVKNLSKEDTVTVEDISTKHKVDLEKAPVPSVEKAQPC